MLDLFERLFNLLTTYPGLLAYHLVIGFSIIAALLASLNLWRPANLVIARRQVLGLSLLLLLQFVMFSCAALAWQKIINADQFLISVARGIELISLLIIIWLWNFPYPVQWADLGFGIFGVIFVSLLSFGIIWVASFSENPPSFSFSWDQVTLICGVVLSLFGILILLVRRPTGWVSGLIMILVLGAGYLFEWLLPLQGAIYSGWLQLSQLIAYPMLIILPLRFVKNELADATQSTFPKNDSFDVIPTDTHTDVIDPSIQPVFLSLLDQSDPVERGFQVVETMARSMPADFCLLAFHSAGKESVEFHYGYDLVHKHRLENITAEGRSLSVVLPILLRGETVRLPANSTVPDLKVLADSLNLRRTGSLLATSFPALQSPALWLLLVFSPFTGRNWTVEDQNHFVWIATPLIKLLEPQIAGPQPMNDKLQSVDSKDAMAQNDADLAKKLHPTDDDEMVWKLEIES